MSEVEEALCLGHCNGGEQRFVGTGMGMGSGVGDGGGGDFFAEDHHPTTTTTYREILAVHTQANVRDLRGGDAGSACAGTVECG